MNPIAANVRRHRAQRSLTQVELAVMADVTERTIQRVEHLSEGESPSLETLKALASALDTDVEALSRPPAPSEEEKVIAETLKRYEIIKLERLERGCDLARVIADADAMIFDSGRIVDDEAADAAAEMHQELTDWIDVWGDIDPLEQRNAEKLLQAHVDALHARGLVVTGARHVLRLRPTAGGDPFAWDVAYVLISRTAEPRLFAVRDKTQPIRF